MDIRNKVTIITGASANVRLATAKLFTKNDVKSSTCYKLKR